jgi:hypothetical protein
MTLVTLLGFVFVVWLVTYVIGKLPISPPWWRTALLVLVAVLAIFWLNTRLHFW